MKRRLLIIILLAAFLGIADLNARIGPVGDDCAYIEFAQAIMRGYGMAWMHPPVPETSGYRTFTLPLLIIPFEYFVPGQYLYYKLIPTIAYILLGFVLIRTWHLRNKAIWLILVLFNPWVVDHAHQILTEIPYLTLSCAVIYGYNRWSRTRVWGRWWLLLVAGLYFLIHLKELGYALLAATLLHGLWLRNRRKTLVLVGLVALLLVGDRFALGLEEGIYGRLTLMKNQYHPEQGILHGSGLAQRVLKRSLEYPLNRFPDFFLLPWFHNIDPHRPDKSINPWFTVKAIPGLILFLIMLRGFWWRWRRGPSIAEIYICAYTAILLVWQSGLPRYLVPITPFLFAYLLYGTRGLARRGLWHLFWVGFLVLQIGTTLQVSSEAQREFLLPHWQAYYQASRWAGQALPGNAVIACRKPALTYLLSGRHTVPYPLDDRAASLRNTIERYHVTHILVDELATGGTLAAEYLRPAMAGLPYRQAVLHHSGHHTELVGLLPGGDQ